MRARTAAVAAAAAAVAAAAALAAAQPWEGPQGGAGAAQEGGGAPWEGGVRVTGGVRHTIPLDRIRAGGPPMDGIPSIDDPAFAPAGAAPFVSDSDVVIGLEVGGDARAYPLFIMVWHEIVNDEVGGLPVAVTYCPLCYTSQVFDRTVGGEAAEFGTSGKLYNSNLLMYDRPTGSYWSQALGQAVRGELAGERLEAVPFDLISWGDWRRLHPGTLVLTTDTGHVRAYGADPYGDYYTSDRIMFPVDHEDGRLHPKEVVVGLEAGGASKAYAQAGVEAAGAVSDEVGGVPVLVASAYPGNARAFDRTVGGQALDFEARGAGFADAQTGTVWDYGGAAVSGPLEGESLRRLPLSPGFWFEWAAFHPGAPLHGGA